MSKSERGLQLGVIGTALGAVLFGLVNSADASVTSPVDYPNVKISDGNATGGHLAFDPSDPKRLIVGIDSGTGCYVKSSIDGGETWGLPVLLPQPPGAICWSNAGHRTPSFAYSTDGKRIYAAYSYQISRNDLPYHGVAFSVSSDHGAHWAPPLLVKSLTEQEDNYSNLIIATSLYDQWIYIVAIYNNYYGSEILFTRSMEFGSNWDISRLIAFSYGTEIAISDASLAVGINDALLISYSESTPYESPWSTVKVASSIDNGLSFSTTIVDQYDKNSSYRYWFQKPDIKVGPFGVAHIIYPRIVFPKKNYVSSAILYKYSLPPYETWSTSPMRLDDASPHTDVRSPQLAVGVCGQTSVLHATWVESHKKTDQVLYTRRVARPGYSWSRPLKTGLRHPEDFWSWSGLAATSDQAFATFSPPLLGTRIWSGVTCP